MGRRDYVRRGEDGRLGLLQRAGFAGEAIRLEPGSYPTLPQDWLNRINSFMCSEPT